MSDISMSHTTMEIMLDPLLGRTTKRVSDNTMSKTEVTFLMNDKDNEKRKDEEIEDIHW